MSTTSTHLKSNLFEAALKGDLKPIQEAISNKKDLDIKDNYGNTPLMKAAEYGNYLLVKTLLNSTDLNIANDCGETALHLAAKGSHVDIVQLLIDAGAKLDLQDKLQRTPLYIAVKKGLNAFPYELDRNRKIFCMRQFLYSKKGILPISKIDQVLLSEFAEQDDLIKLFIEVNQGNAEAQTKLGICFERGTDVQQDINIAVELYKKAANLGHPIAQTNLGACYEHSMGVDEDLKMAVELYQKAADQSYAIAQVKLGVCFEKGEGVEKNIKKAIELYRKAIEKGNKNALAKLLDLPISTIIQHLEINEILHTYDCAMDMGLTDTYIKLAKLYEEGCLAFHQNYINRSITAGEIYDNVYAFFIQYTGQPVDKISKLISEYSTQQIKKYSYY